MKFLVLLCLFGFTYGTPNTKLGGRILNDQLTKVLEAFRITLKEGNPEAGIPIMDPLQMDTIAFELGQENKLTINIAAGGIYLTGLSDFEVNDVEVSIIPLGLKYDITLPMSILNTETYSLKGLVFGALPIYGDGKAYFEIGGLRFSGVAALQVKDGDVAVKDLNLRIGIDSMLSQTTGMLGGGDIDNVINAIIGDLAVEFFNSYSDIISGQVNNIMLPHINKMLEGMTLKDLIGLINGSGA